MSTYEPSPSEVRLTLLLGNTLARPFYTSYINRLDLRGDERVLDFGSGSGVCSQHLVRRLLKSNGHLTCVDVSRIWQQVIQKTLRGYPNVDYVCGDIATLDIPDASYDVVLVHFVLHDIPAIERSDIVKHLARLLVDGGKVFVREPLRFISQEEIHRLMQQNGLAEMNSRLTEIWTQGTVYEGVFHKCNRS